MSRPGLFELFTFLEMLKGAGEAPAPGPPGPPGPPAPVGPPMPPGPEVIPPPGVLPVPAVIPAVVPAPAVVPPIPIAPVAPPGGIPPMPPWPPAPAPGTLPPFPGPGWVPDAPVTPTVAARASYWNPLLWDYPSKTQRKPYVQEQLGGQWVTFAAAWHPGDKGPQTYMATEAWRLASAPPIAPPAVIPTPAAPVGPIARPGPVGPEPKPGAWQTDAAYIRRYQSALTYLAETVPGAAGRWDPHGIDGKYGPNTAAAVKAYQADHALSVDGQCGPQTAASLDAVLGYRPAPSPGAPGAPVAPPAAAPAVGPPAPVQPYPGPGAWQTNAAYIKRYQSALSYLSSINPAFNPQGVDGKFGAHTKAAVMAFQQAHGLTADGEAGAATAAALDAAMAGP